MLLPTSSWCSISSNSSWYTPSPPGTITASIYIFSSSARNHYPPWGQCEGGVRREVEVHAIFTISMLKDVAERRKTLRQCWLTWINEIISLKTHYTSIYLTFPSQLPPPPPSSKTARLDWGQPSLKVVEVHLLGDARKPGDDLPLPLSERKMKEWKSNEGVKTAYLLFYNFFTSYGGTSPASWPTWASTRTWRCLPSSPERGSTLPGPSSDLPTPILLRTSHLFLLRIFFFHNIQGRAGATELLDSSTHFKQLLLLFLSDLSQPPPSQGLPGHAGETGAGGGRHLQS